MYTVFAISKSEDTSLDTIQTLATTACEGSDHVVSKEGQSLHIGEGEDRVVVRMHADAGADNAALGADFAGHDLRFEITGAKPSDEPYLWLLDALDDHPRVRLYDANRSEPLDMAWFRGSSLEIWAGTGGFLRYRIEDPAGNALGDVAVWLAEFNAAITQTLTSWGLKRGYETWMWLGSPWPSTGFVLREIDMNAPPSGTFSGPPQYFLHRQFDARNAAKHPAGDAWAGGSGNTWFSIQVDGSVVAFTHKPDGSDEAGAGWWSGTALPDRLIKADDGKIHFQPATPSSLAATFPGQVWPLEKLGE